jgi:hypothetical protein
VAAIQLLVVVQPRRIAVLVGARLHRQWARRTHCLKYGRSGNGCSV